MENKEHVGAFKPERHPSARFSRNLPHIGTFKPGRHSSARLSRDTLVLLNRKDTLRDVWAGTIR